jgi:uncharacterized membrane protein
MKVEGIAMDDSFRERLRHETVVWQQEQLISESQARAILARYGLVEGELEERRSKIVVALGFIGALLVGIGAITFFAANWPLIPGWFKLLLIVSSVIGAYTAGYGMRFERQWSPRVGSALIFLGALLFGAAIFLIAQGFHVRANEPTLVYLWAIGILPMAYLLAAPSLVWRGCSSRSLSPSRRARPSSSGSLPSIPASSSAATTWS